MENKKVSTSFAFTVVILLALIFGFIFVMFQRNIFDESNFSVQTTKPSVKKEVNLPENILIHNDIKLENIDALTKKVTPVEYITRFSSLDGYSGLPAEYKNENTSLSNTIDLVSDDRSKFIVFSNTYDEKGDPSAFTGINSILESEEFVCEVSTKKCEKSN